MLSKSFYITVIGLVILFQSDVVQSFKSRIINGTLVKPAAIPYQIFFGYNDDEFCGGSILNENYVLTAAHCVEPVNQEQPTRVIAGAINIDELTDFSSVHKVTKFIWHEDYVRDDNWINDIALLKVEPPFKFNPHVQPVKLPEANLTLEYGTVVTVSGYGRVSENESISSELLQTQVYVTKEEECDDEIDLRPTQICAGNPSQETGFCRGDSGGPLSINGTVVGIVSWSFNKGCAMALSKSQVYTRVSSYLEWISSHIEDN